MPTQPKTSQHLPKCWRNFGNILPKFAGSWAGLLVRLHWRLHFAMRSLLTSTKWWSRRTNPWRMTRKRTSSFNLTFSAGVLFQRQPQVVVVISRPSSLLHSVTSSFYDPCPPDFWPLSLRRTLSQLHKLVVKFHETKRPLDMFSHISRNLVVSLEILEKNPQCSDRKCACFS